MGWERGVPRGRRSGAVRAGERPGRGFHGSGRSLLSVCPCVGGGFEASGAPPPDLLAAECNFRALPWKLPWLLVGEARGCVVLRGGIGGRERNGLNAGGWGGSGGDCWRVGARRCAPSRAVPFRAARYCCIALH